MKKLIILSVLYLVLIFLSFFVFCDPVSVQTAAIVLTGLVIIWYTHETALLREETVRQTELELRPFVLAEIVDSKILVTNYGNGIALNVYIKPIVIDEGLDIVIKFEENIPILKRDESLVMAAETYDRGVSKGDFFLEHLNPDNAVYELKTEIFYENIENKKYSSKITTSSKSKKISGIIVK